MGCLVVSEARKMDNQLIQEQIIINQRLGNDLMLYGMYDRPKHKQNQNEHIAGAAN
jgi:hypothetical protein